MKNLKKKIKQQFHQEADQEAEMYVSYFNRVEKKNYMGWDSRLDSIEGTSEVLSELKNRANLHGTYLIPALNIDPDTGEGNVYFEV